MMSENYRDFIRAYRPDSIFYHAVSMIAYYLVKDDKHKIGVPYAIGKDDSAYRMRLQMGVNHKIVNDEMLCTHKDSKGTNEVVMRGACEYISEELLHIPTDNKELFIKDILHQLSGTYYRLLEPIFKDKKRYVKVYNLLIDDNDHKEKQSYEFVNWAYQNYQSFISFLYGICEKHNIDLDSLQDDNDLRITPYKSSKPKSTSITKKKTTTLSSDERAKKIERVVQNLDDIFNVATKRKYDKLTTDLAKYAIDRCKTGKDIYALATFLYRCKNITIVSKPNTITKWINVFKSACENDLQTDNYKPNKVNPQIKEVMKYFTYLQI